MKAGLQTAAMNFRRALSRTMANVASNATAEITRQGSTDPSQIARSLQNWKRNTPYAGVIANVYWWDGSAASSQLLRLLPDGDQFESVAWPSRFESLHARLQTLSSHSFAMGNHPGPPRPWEGRGERGSGYPPEPMRHSQDIWHIDQHIPALIHRWDSYPHDPQPKNSDARPWLLIELSPSVLQSSVFAGMVQHFFGDPESGDYEVEVLDAGSNETHLFFASAPNMTAWDAASADASLNLFGPPGAPSGPPNSGMGFTHFFPGGMHSAPLRGENAPDWLGPVRIDPLYYSAQDRGWQLLVRHRMGSIEAAAAALRHRNLFLGFGVLLVLAATMALILFTSRRAQRLAHMQMEFVAGVSHELRTPIAVISSAAENLADGVVKNPEMLARYAAAIRNQTKQLNHLVDQALRFASTRNGNSNYSVCAVDVAQAIHLALENTPGLSDEFHIDFQLEPGLPPVSADPGGLSQCLQNLISNAVKYGGNSRWIGIRAGALQHGNAGSQVNITVEDRGIGIGTPELKRVFDPFYRASSVSSSNIHGSGLGLALAKRFVDDMGGELTVESELGKGTTFSLRLPIAQD